MKGERFQACDDRSSRAGVAAFEEEPDKDTYSVKFGAIIPWIALPNGTVVSVGPPGLQQLNLTTADVLGTNWASAIHTADRRALRRAWRAAFETGGAFDIECRIRLADGEHRWFHLRAIAQRDVHGQILRWRGTAEDCDASRRAIDSLRASEERYRLATKATNDVVWDWNFETGQLTWSEAMCSQLGHALSPETSHGDWWKAQIHPHDRARVIASIQGAIKAGSSDRWRESYRFLRGDGQYADIVDCGFVVTDETGKATRMIGAMMDQTARNRTAAALHLSEERYRYTIELGEQIAWTASSDGTATEVGLRWSQLTGRPIEEALDMRFFSVVHLEDVIHLQSIWQESVVTGKPFDFTYRLILHDKSFRWMRARGAPLRDDAGNILRWYGTIEDVHQQRLAELDVAWRASHDALTELINREVFQNCLDSSLHQAAAKGGAVAIMIFDIDRFKLINDRYGHAAGDAVLRWIAQQLSALQLVTAARLGGDEFAVLLQAEDTEKAQGKVRDVFLTLRGVVQVDNIGIECHVSAGYAVYLCHGTTSEELIKSADLALYDAKARGRNCLRPFRPELRIEIQRNAFMLSLAQEVLRNQRIRPFYQPKVDLASGRVVGFEALLRWEHPTRGVQAPDTLAAAFDDRDLGCQISRSMQREVIGDMRGWLQSGLAFGHIALNASDVDLRRPGFAEELLSHLAAADVPPTLLEIEIVESVFLGRDLDIVEEAFATLTGSGISLSLDDFGTGYASLSHLRRFPVSVLKIDKSFVAPLSWNDIDEPIVSAVIGLAKSFRMKTVAEGIETVDQARMLHRASCDYGQGFLFSPARSAADVPELTRRCFHAFTTR